MRLTVFWNGCNLLILLGAIGLTLVIRNHVDTILRFRSNVPTFLEEAGEIRKKKVGTDLCSRRSKIEKSKKGNRSKPNVGTNAIFLLYIYIVNTNKSKVSKKAPSKINNLQHPKNSLPQQSVPLVKKNIGTTGTAGTALY